MSFKPKCPRCGGAGSDLDLERVRRRFIDRLLSVIRLRYRYRCRAGNCNWQGSLPAGRARSPVLPIH